MRGDGELADVSADVWRFHEAARHLWNATFLPFGVDVTVADRYGAVLQSLFATLVLEPAGLRGARMAHESEAAPASIADFLVVPKADGVPIHVASGIPAGGAWDDPIANVPTPASAELEFVHFFDFDRLGRRDLQYVRVRIARFVGAEEVVGRDGLVHAGHVRFLRRVRPGA